MNRILIQQRSGGGDTDETENCPCKQCDRTCLEENDMEKNEFVAKKINFNGTSGYMVSQLAGGKTICEQFISEDGYKSFCEAIGIVPGMIE